MRTQSHIKKEQVMREFTAFVGLDVDKNSISAALMTGKGDAVEIGRHWGQSLKYKITGAGQVFVA